MPSLQNLVAADIMRRGVLSVRPGQSVAEVERQLVENHVTAMPVIEHGRMVGIVSRSDITRARVLTGSLDAQVSDQVHWGDTQADGFDHAAHSDFHGFQQGIMKFTAKDVMRSQVVTCAPSTPITEVAASLVKHHIHRVVVVEGDRPVGIVSALDIAAVVAKSKE